MQHADRARAHHATGNERAARKDQRIDRIAIVRQGVRHEAVIRRIAHRGVQDAVDEQRAAGLVELVLHRLAASGHLDDHIEVLGRVVAHGDEFDLHGARL